MFLEELDRQEIDCLLAQCRWLVENRRKLNITAGMGVAVREATLGTGESDFLLLVDGKVAGVIEAKLPGFSLTTAETQSQKYHSGLHARYPHHSLQSRFEYRPDKKNMAFTNGGDANPCSQERSRLLRTGALLRLVPEETQPLSVNSTSGLNA